MSNLEEFSALLLEKGNVTAEDMKDLDWLAEVQCDPARYFKPALKEMVKRMPRIRGGGRPRLPETEQEKQKLRDEVNGLIRNGKVRVSAALQRVAARSGVSHRTMQ